MILNRDRARRLRLESSQRPAVRTTEPRPADALAEIERLRAAVRLLGGDSPDGKALAERLIQGK